MTPIANVKTPTERGSLGGESSIELLQRPRITSEGLRLISKLDQVQSLFLRSIETQSVEPERGSWESIGAMKLTGLSCLRVSMTDDGLACLGKQSGMTSLSIFDAPPPSPPAPADPRPPPPKPAATEFPQQFVVAQLPSRGHALRHRRLVGIRRVPKDLLRHHR